MRWGGRRVGQAVERDEIVTPVAVDYYTDAQLAVELLAAEVEQCMRLLGITSLDQLEPGMVRLRERP